MSDQDARRPIDIESLESIAARLRESLDAYRIDPSNLFVLDSVIKRFELTYELSFRGFRRCLLGYAPSDPEIEDMSFAGIVRRGQKERLLQTGWPYWKDFKQARDNTVHTYRIATARDVAEKASACLPEAEYLVAALRERMQIHG